eukprot:724979-Rhodomonas_salina.1
MILCTSPLYATRTAGSAPVVCGRCGESGGAASAIVSSFARIMFTCADQPAFVGTSAQHDRVRAGACQPARQRAHD